MLKHEAKEEAKEKAADGLEAASISTAGH